MHWTDRFNELNIDVKEYSEAGQRLTGVLRSEGWKPEEIERFANPVFVDIRRATLESLRLR